MADDCVILCGTDYVGKAPGGARAPLRLRIWGPRPNIFLRIDDLHQALWAPVPDTLQDLLDLAAYVYSADQCLPRGTDKDEDFGVNWRRRLHFSFGVRRPDVWRDSAVCEDLTEALSFLSEDEYHFHFEPLEEVARFEDYFHFSSGPFGGTVQEVALFSGGLDSLAGAARAALLEKRQVLLVNHRPNPKLEPVTRNLARELRTRAPQVPPIYVPVRVNKERGLSREQTQRTRSFLFVALGAAFAAMLRLDRFRLYENGVVSLNLPPSAQVVGARASRTTHPRVLRTFTRLLTRLAHKPLVVENPFEWMTKAQVVRLLAESGCAELIGLTRSCSYPRRASNEEPHCGICSQCIDRRFAVLAAGQAGNDPADAYVVDLLTGARDAGRAQTMLAMYTEMASQIERTTFAGFFARYGEACRVFGALSEPPAVVAQRVYQMYLQHARDVAGAIDHGISEHREALRRRELSPTCLLRMVLVRTSPRRRHHQTKRPRWDPMCSVVRERRGRSATPVASTSSCCPAGGRHTCTCLCQAREWRCQRLGWLAS
jgi:7-cyano-7-deazaguanine synthase in queuosine biosynthesis